jgi:coenzyme F420 hydrogenase subunit beta
MKKKGIISQVIDTHLCSGCGTCAGMCPTGSVEMVEWAGGVLRPEINRELCSDCGICLRICPGIQVKRKHVGLGDPFVGDISAAYAGQINDSGLLASAQSGGIVTGLLLYALEVGYIDAALVTSQDVNGSIRPVVKLTGDPDEIIRAQQSKYCPVALNTMVPLIRKSGKRVAIVGLPCHIHGLWNIEKEIPNCLNNVVMRIGLFCDRMLTYGAIDALVRGAGLVTHTITEFRYRSKKWRGWPGDVYIKNNNGEEVNLPREVRYVMKDDFTPVRCRLCYDKLNTFADVSVGDSYGIGDSIEGISSIIVRNETIHKLILNAAKAGKIKLQDVDPYRIACGQAIEERRKQFALFVSAWERMGHTAPRYSLNYNSTKVPESVDLTVHENVLTSALRHHEKSDAEYSPSDDAFHNKMNYFTEGSRISPLVTVCMIGNGNDKFIKKSIDSVLHQTYRNIELIIAGGKSSTKIQKIVRNIKSEKVRYVHEICGDNVQVVHHARGEFIALLDSSDEYESNKIEIEVALMLGNPTLDAVYSNFNVVDEKGESVGLIWPYHRHMPGELLSKLSRNGKETIPLYTIMMRRRLADELGLHDIASITLDDQRISQLTARNKIKHVFLPLYKYRCLQLQAPDRTLTA